MLKVQLCFAAQSNTLFHLFMIFLSLLCVSAKYFPTQCGQSDEDDDDEGNHEDDQDEYLNLAQKQKQGANSLRDALEEEVSRKKRKRGIVK